MNKKNKLIKQWLFFAESDLKSAKASLGESVYHIVCFHSQQTAEKSLKALLAFQNQIIPKTHDLLYLLRKLRNNQDFLMFREELNFLNQFYVPTRYPEAFPGSLPEGLPDQKDAEKAVEYAGKIVSYVIKKIIL